MKLYVAIQRFLNKNWVHYIVLFFILISIVAVIASSFEEMSRYRLALFGITYISSFVFLLEYAARILSAPALHPTKSAIKARLLYTFSFYGFVDFVAILPCVLTYIYWNTEVVHIIPLYFHHIQADTPFPFVPLDWKSSLFRQRGTCYGLYSQFHYYLFLGHPHVLHRAECPTRCI